jgi:hypothetical protein
LDLICSENIETASSIFPLERAIFASAKSTDNSGIEIGSSSNVSDINSSEFIDS